MPPLKEEQGHVPQNCNPDHRQRLPGRLQHVGSRPEASVSATGHWPVHSTYLTGMITNLVTTGAQGYIGQTARDAWADTKVSLLSGIWVAFVAEATLGTALVFRLGALGILGTALVLFALFLRESFAILRVTDTR
jgi:uncharacterized membrane protein YoaK (UPF0700 family)